MLTDALVAALLLAQVVDLVTTYLAIKRGAYEANPLLVKLADFMRRFTSARWAWLVWSKAAVMALISLIALNDGFDSAVATVALLAVVGVYAWVLRSNVRVLWRQRG